jgi:energy-converting hydrogenase A subunit R
VLDFSAQHILIMSGADALLRWMDSTGHGFIISTSYKPYIQALCDIVGFPFQNTYSTKLDLDVLEPSEEECQNVRNIADQILSLPELEWGSDVQEVEALPGDVKDAFFRIDEMITNELEMTYLGGYLKEVEPVGGEEKAKAVRKSCEKTGQDLSHVIYIGDSITDVQAFQLVRENGGMTVAFNANRYAIAVAEIACLSNHSDILAILCQVFWERGRQGIREFIEGWQMGGPHIKRLISTLQLGDALWKKEERHRSSLQSITDENRASLISQSEVFRGQVRGEEIGRLG